MARKTITDLQLRKGVWHIDKQVKGHGRLCESTETGCREEAERYLIHRLENIRKSSVYGERPDYIWRKAATRYLQEYAHQRSIWLAGIYLGQLDPYIGDMPISEIDDEALEPYVDHRLDQGISNRTINIALERVIRVLSLCARKWRYDKKRYWIDSVPMVEKLCEKNGRKPYPLDWDEQKIFFSELPGHLQKMALYKVNTGSREQEVCKLRWEWEIPVPALNTSVFLLPADFGGRYEDSGVKNGDERLIVLNSTAKAIISKQRGIHPEWVFPYDDTALHRMNDTAWRNARARAADKWEELNGMPAHPGFRRVRVHDLKHTFGRRLRAADVPEEDRKVLLGHTNGSVTSHYSGAELGKLIEYADRIIATDQQTPVLTLLKRRA